MLLLIAFRNIWRNKRRTLITAASVFFALFFILIMRSIQIGSFGKMTNDMISSYTGHIQVHAKGYWEEPSVNTVFEREKEKETLILNHPDVMSIVPRMESGALASVGIKTKPCGVIGIDPENENRMTKLSGKIIEGVYLKPDDKGVLIGDKLAGWLGLGINDTLIMIGQGYHSMSAAGKYPVRGIVHLPAPDLNSRMVWLTLSEAQSFYSVDDRLTSLSILLKDESKIGTVRTDISEIMGTEEYEVMTWNELLVELEQLIESKQGSSYILAAMLYMIVAFGIFGTVVMMTAERWREFGLLASIGMKKIRLMVTVFIEMMLLGMLGIAAAFSVTLPFMIYFNRNPIRLTGEMSQTTDKMGIEGVLVLSDDHGFMVNQIIVVVIIILVATAYPILKLRKLKPVEAMKS
jgi:ABC-type lipoprotein release transport system permease subunit